jgi:cellulose synthase/poly-beta-1,6-N-acetylglucosamine synthase-like glycosyltransferase
VLVFLVVIAMLAVIITIVRALFAERVNVPVRHRLEARTASVNQPGEGEATPELLPTVGPGPELASALFTGAPPVEVEDMHPQARLRRSAHHLRITLPQLSAYHTLESRQRYGLLAAGFVALIALTVLRQNAVILLIAFLILSYLAALTFRLYLFWTALRSPGEVVISDEEARAVPDELLPVYTVLVPAFHEPEVMEHLIANLRGLDYPASRLDIKLLLEEDDDATVAAARELIAPDDEGIEIVLVPEGDPRTKPKALNYGLSLSHGQLVTIYDAEDRPDPLQLRKAAVALGRASDNVACIQAKLVFFNTQQNLITRWFDIEYRMWFSQLLPGLSHVHAPIPLGGTSNHFRRDVLTEVGGWDPYNVTEDADLGVRLHRRGYKTAVLESTTYEEANSDFVNWVKQRSRWYKGYLQTWLVHCRRPRSLLHDLGWKGFLMFHLFVGGTPLLAMLNPVFWLMTILWFVAHPGFILHVFPAPVYYAGLLCWLGGNFVFLYACMLSAYETKQPKLTVAAALMPLYWVMMALAAAKAAIQIVWNPSYWEKTQHGLNLVPREPPQAEPQSA